MSVATTEARAGASPEQRSTASARDDRHRKTQAKATAAYVAVPLDVVWNADISDGAFRTYCILKRYCFGRRDYCWPSIVTLAAERGCSDETIRRHVAELVKAGLVRVAKKGRHNVYWFVGGGEGRPKDGPVRQEEQIRAGRPEGRAVATTGPSATPRVAGHTPRSAQDDRSLAGVSSPGSDAPPDRGGRVHTSEGQGFKKEGKATTAVAAYTKIEETLATLVANGVAEPAARRLIGTHGIDTCRQAVGLLDWERSRGAHIRNAGGWLYAAITQGFVRPPKDTPTAPSPAPTIPAERLCALRLADDHAHAAQLQDRRRDALLRRGIPEHADLLWQRVRARLAAEGQGNRLLAAAYLRPMDDDTWRLEGAAGGLGDKLAELLPTVEEALQAETGKRTTVSLQA